MSFFSGTLQTCNQNDRRRHVGHAELVFGSAQGKNELVIDNLGELLPGRYTGQNPLPFSFQLHFSGEFTRNLIIHIGIQQCTTYLPYGLSDIDLGDRRLPRKRLEYGS